MQNCIKLSPRSRAISFDLEPLCETSHPIVYLSEPGGEQYLLPADLVDGKLG